MSARTLTRFVILGSGRTGSNLLAGLLNSHPAACCYGELFNPRDPATILWRVEGREVTPALLELRDRDPVELVERWVFATQSDQVLAAGFKIFYHHAREGAWSPVWPFLRSLPELKVLHLRRRNLLKKFLSLELAKRTDRWEIVKDEDAHQDVSITVDPKKCVRFFERSVRLEREGVDYFAEHDVLEMTYEDLAANIANESMRVLDHLGLERIELTTKTKKQIRQPLSRAIANHAELEAAFAGTEWARFFED